MNNDITVSELTDKLLELAKKKHGSDFMYAHTVGVLQALFEHARWGLTPIQKIVNEKFAEVEKDLASA